MEKAEVEEYFTLEGYPDIQAGIVNWPMFLSMHLRRRIPTIPLPPLPEEGERILNWIWCLETTFVRRSILWDCSILMRSSTILRRKISVLSKLWALQFFPQD